MGRMDRSVDKLLVLVCCLPALALTAADTPFAASLLIALGLSAFSEIGAGAHATPPALRTASAALSAAYLATACLVPAGLPFMALAVYDLAARRRTSPAALIAAVALCLGARAGVTPAVLLLSACSCAMATVLSLRTAHAAARQAGSRRERDTLREQSLALEKSNRDLLDRQAYEARLATLTERSRIAREIHDSVGHLLTRGIMQMEALKAIHANDQQALAELSPVADTLHEALDTMRQSVHGMADTTCDLSVQLRRVADEACRGTGLTAACTIDAATASPQVTACLTAVLREALSNTLRHARQATCVRVELVEHPGLWRLTVTDDGLAPASARPGRPDARGAGLLASGAMDSDLGNGGMGLLSMEQRVRALGGTMSAGYSNSAHGFVVHVSIPREEAAA